jgi:hypothetical protein
MQFTRMLGGLLLATLMAACGGGGGSAGTTSGSGSNGSPTIAVEPTIGLALVGSTGTSTTTVGGLTPVYARATVRDSSGAPVGGVVVTFGVASTLARFIPSSGTALTDSNGLASVQILPAAADSAGAGVLTADVAVAGKDAKQATLSFQVPQSSAVDPSTAKVTNFVLLLDKSTLKNSGVETAKLTVVAVDANNNVAVGAKVNVATDANTVFTPDAVVTDSQGQYTGHVGIGGDKSDRQVTLAVTVNGVTKQTTLQIVGSKVTLQAVPPTPAPGQTVVLTTKLTDSASNPIPGVIVTFGGTIPALQGQTVKTDSSGSAVKSFTAPATPDIYTITASGSGVSAADYQLQVFNTVIPAAVIPAGAVPSLSASPNVLAVNSAGASASQSTLRFLFVDAANRPIPNVRVRFADLTVGLAAVGASISSGGSTLFTDTSGTVSAQYIAGQNSSPTNGVTVQACYSATDFASSADCPAQVKTTLTTAGQALAVSIGDDNKLQKGGGGGTYIKQFVITVADAAGRAVPNAPVDISVDLTHYSKGLVTGVVSTTTTSGSPSVTITTTSTQVITPLTWLSVIPTNPLASWPSATTVPGTGRVWCANEDTNRNGIADPGENIDGSIDSTGQLTLQPRKSDLIVNYADPTVTTTDANGILLIKVEYSQRYATWLAYKLRVTASVQGSQGMAERLFITWFAEGDDVNGSFLQPPYGFNACNVAN